MLTDEQTKECLARNVLSRITELGWTQSRLADESGENNMMISRICNKTHLASARVVRRIAEAMGVSTDYLLRELPPVKKSRKQA